jgi:hypothetical protein
MSANTLDHIVIAAATLEQGADYVESKLGVAPSPGGRHPTQGTHNSLLKLGSNRYLEVIAIDAEGKKPEHPRWFGLDSEWLQERLRERPRLLTWVARTADVARLTSLSPEPLGSVKHLSRGPYRWCMCYQDDGGLVAGGLIPLIIQWEGAEHPTASMADCGCSLAALRGSHPDPGRVRLTLEAMGLSDEIEVEAGGRVRESGLEAEIRCPLGRAIFD